jgi:hypothetical protein
MGVMEKLLGVVEFVAVSFAMWLLLAFVLVGVTCFRHGDIGPYPEADYIPWAAPVAMLVTYVFMGNNRGVR